MGSENKKRQFKWSSGNGPVFPIDYSQRGFAKYLDKDPRQIKRYVTSHPFFRDILRGQFSKDPKKGDQLDRPDNAVISIPVEWPGVIRK